MRSENISSEEWRWVAILSGVLVALMLIPYAWALAASDSQYAFMGILPNPQDGATYLSKIQQGREGAWLFELRHTPQDHTPAGFHMFYLTLGHIARLLGLSNVVIFHLARVAASFFMFAALYQLGANIWMRIRPRRLFFLLTSVGSGLGWLVLIFNQEALAVDITVPEAFPLLAAYTNPHFPLAIGLIALITGQFLTVFRPGFEEAPTGENGGLMMILLTILLALVSPPGTIVLGGALIVFLLARTFRYREIPYHQIRWSAMLLLPAAPFALYYVFVFRFNETMQIFNEQNQTPSPNPLLFIFGYGLLLMVAIPGLVRAIRRFEADGDQLMVSWFVFNTLAVYTPGFDLQRRLFIGLLIPIVYFAIRSIEDYWVERIPEKWQMPALIAMIVFILPTHFFTFGAPLAQAVMLREEGAKNFLLVDADYVEAFAWLDANSQTEDVVLAAPTVALWVPAKTHLRVVYGHPYETIPAELRREQVMQFYRGEGGEDACTALFDPALPFSIDYVLWGPAEDYTGSLTAAEFEERGLSVPEDRETIETRLPTADTCQLWLAQLENIEVRQFGDVTLYVIHDTAP